MDCSQRRGGCCRRQQPAALMTTTVAIRGCWGGDPPSSDARCGCRRNLSGWPPASHVTWGGEGGGGTCRAAANAAADNADDNCHIGGVRSDGVVEDDGDDDNLDNNDDNEGNAGVHRAGMSIFQMFQFCLAQKWYQCSPHRANCTKPRRGLVADSVSRLMVQGWEHSTSGSGQTMVRSGRDPISYPIGQPSWS